MREHTLSSVCMEEISIVLQSRCKTFVRFCHHQCQIELGRFPSQSEGFQGQAIQAHTCASDAQGKWAERLDFCLVRFLEDEHRFEEGRAAGVTLQSQAFGE